MSKIGRMTLEMKPILGQGFLRFSNFSGEGQVETENGNLEIKYSKWDPSVQMTIKKALAMQLGIPDNFRVTVEWD